MVLAMASQDVQSFFQPLSSWISQVYEALQQAGDTLSASLVHLNKQDSKLRDKPDQGLDDIQSQETCFEGEEQGDKWRQEDENSLFLEEDHFSCCYSDLQDSVQTLSPRFRQHTKDSCSVGSRWPCETLDGPKPHELSSVPEEEHRFEKPRCGLQQGFDAHLPGTLEKVNGKRQVNSFGDDEEPSTSSDSNEDVIKQFEISVSRSQSFRAGASKKGKPTESEQKPKGSRLLSAHRDDSAEAPTCEDLDGTSQLSYSEILSYRDQPISTLSRSLCENRGTRHHGTSHQETSAAQGISCQSAEGSLEMDTAFTSQGFEDSYATDTSSMWSPEEQDGTNLQVPSKILEPISKCGDLDVIFEYRAVTQKLTVTIIRAQGLPDKDRCGVNSWQVHIVLLPSKKQRGRTNIQRGSNPVFKEKVTFTKLEPRDVASCAVRFRLYAARKMTRERMMGEKLFCLNHLHPEGEMKVTLVLEPRSHISSGESPLSPSVVSHSDSASSTQSLSHGGVPELLVGLSYNATTGRLSVEMIKGSHFRNLAVNRAPDTYGKLFLLNCVGQEMSRCKTSIRRGQPNPVYKETFVFQVALFQLSDVTLMISVYNRRTMKRKEMIGWIALGQNCSGEEERDHWEEMKETKGQQICRWHTLLES